MKLRGNLGLTRRDFIMFGGGATAMFGAVALRRELFLRSMRARAFPVENHASHDLPYYWSLVTGSAAFPAMDGAGALTFKGRMWLLGGWNPLIYKKNNHTHSEIWSSANGTDWQREPDGPWPPRHAVGYAVHDGRMWIIGSDFTGNRHLSDVWWTKDGRRWELATLEAPWGPRALHFVAAFNDRLWVMGGQTLPDFTPSAPRFYSDVWSSIDGVQWVKMSDNQPWAPRGMIGGSAIHQEKMWIMGGGTYQSERFQGRQRNNDVWSSPDGRNWTRVAPIAPWQPRSYHHVAAWDDRLWVVAGHDGGPPERAGDLSDVWYSKDGLDWTQLPNTPWRPRHAASLFVHEDSLWIAGGVTSPFLCDVWRLRRK